MSRAPLLCFAPGSCARVPMIALEEIGAPFETRLIAFMAGEHRSPDYLAVNPSGKVPALVLPEGVLTQNPAILYYLARRHPEANLLPPAGNLFGEAQGMAMLGRFSGDIHPFVTRFAMTHMMTRNPEGMAELKGFAASNLAFHMGSFEAVLAGRDWLLESGWSALDAYLFWVWFRITGVGFDTAPFPHITRHHAAMHQRPSVIRALAREAEALAVLEARGLVTPKS
jgi:glutathione S-transferase